MTKSRLMLLAPLLGAVLATGCSSLAGRSCLDAPSAVDTEDHAPLRIPVGLDAPDTRAALEIPALTEPEAPSPGGRCLEDPPPANFVASASAAPEEEAEPKRERPQRVRPKGPRSGR